MEQKKVTMTKDQIIVELMELLKQNSRERQAEELAALSSYVEKLEEKIDGLAYEVFNMNKELSELRIKKGSTYIRNVLADAITGTEKRILQMRNNISQIHSDMREMASGICTEFKKTGKRALNKVTEFLEIRERLENLRGNLDKGMIETDQTLLRIEGFEEGIRSANEQLINSFRILSGRESKDYSSEDYFKWDISLMKKPWVWQKKIYQNMIPFIEGAIKKLDNLSRDVQLSKMMSRWDELYEQVQEKEISQNENEMTMVSEQKYEYGADQFEKYMESNVNQHESGKGLEEVNLKEKGRSL